MSLPFSDRCVVVTGAGAGIGRAIAAGFCADSATVIGIGRTRVDLEGTVALCPSGRMHFVVGDVGRVDDVARLFAEARRLCQKVDILVNNAALYPKVAFLDSTPEDWAQVIRANVLGMAYCCHMALPGMLERGFGRIINMGSLAWMGPIAKSSAYSSSKAAVRALTRALATEIDRARYPDVLVNELLPGIVKTAMSDSGIEPGDVYPHVRFLAGLPQGGPTGKTFLQSDLYTEDHGIRARLKLLIGRLLRR